MSSDEPGIESLPTQWDNPGVVFERFTRRLIGLAGTHLQHRLRHKVDPEDIVQSVYKSFFLRYGEGALAAEGWEGLWGLLTVITIRKCADRARFFTAERRDAAREVSPRRTEDNTSWYEAAGREPTPDQAAMLAETVEGLLARFDEDERTIIEMSLQGFSTQEISDHTGRAERSVRRLRERVRRHLENRQNSGVL